MAFGDADASGPTFASVNSGNVVTTTSFTPPAGALLVAHAFHDTASGNTTNTSAITDSGGGSWTVPANGTMNRAVAGGQNGHVQVSYSVASGSAITVTSTGTNCAGSAGLYVRVITGAAAAVFDVALVRGGATASVVSLALAASVTDGARGFLVASDWNVAANMTAGTGQTAVVAQGIGTGPDMRVYVGVTTAVVSPAGTTQTMSTASPSAGNTWNAVAYLLRPAAGTNLNPGSGAVTVAGADAALAVATAAGSAAVTAAAANATLAVATSAGSGAVAVAAGNASLKASIAAGSGAVGVVAGDVHLTVGVTVTPGFAAVAVAAGNASLAVARSATGAAVAVASSNASLAVAASPGSVAVALAAAPVGLAVGRSVTGAAVGVAAGDVTLSLATVLFVGAALVSVGGGGGAVLSAPTGGIAGDLHGPLPMAPGSITVHTESIAGAITN